MSWDLVRFWALGDAEPSVSDAVVVTRMTVIGGCLSPRHGGSSGC